MKITIDMRGLAATFKRAPEVILSEMSRGAKEGLVDIQRDARATHKFNRQSGNAGGNAERSVTVNFKSFKDPEAKGVYLELGIAPYARRLHQGYVGKTDKLGRKFSGPQPDKFLYEAAERGRNNLINKINMGIGKAIIKLGLEKK